MEGEEVKRERERAAEIQVLITSCNKIFFFLLNNYLERTHQSVKLHVENVDTSPPCHYINTRRE